ncbi:MAG: M42 family peptidase [Chloroflexota bacterium]|nr:M42 family peptidase [Chloroflexota bacterium]
MSAREEVAIFDLVKTLTELPGPVGYEDAVLDWLEIRWGGCSQEVRRTRVDNVLARIGGSGRRLLIMGHADEICLMVKSVTDGGHLHLWPYYGDTLGHPPRWFMPASQPALVLTDDGAVEGIIATASGHVVGGRNSKKERLEWNDLFVDLGVRSREAVEELGVHPGCRVIWNPSTRRLGARGIVGKAMDDRAALAIATLAGERLAGRDDLAYEVWLASTVQEENGLIGASSVVDELPIDVCINLDVGLIGDFPGPDERDFPSRLGAGPILVYQDNSCHYSRQLTDGLVALAREQGIPVQQAIFQNFGSDGAALIRRGVETALLTYPTRYTHSAIELVDEDDLMACVDLIVAFATTPSNR